MLLSNRIGKIATDNPTGDPTVLAQTFLDALPRSELVKMLAEMIEDAQRVRVRYLERSAFSPFIDKQGGISDAAVAGADFDSLQRVKAILDRPVSLGMKTDFRPPWGSLTIEEHLTRIAFLSKQRDGMNVTISQHHVAIKLIEKAGVKCLNDLPEFATEEADAA